MMQEINIYKMAEDIFGKKNQMIVAIEELSECQKELTKMLRNKGNKHHLAEEIADVQIMLNQMELMFGLSVDVMEWKEKKLGRLERRIKYGKE